MKKYLSHIFILTFILGITGVFGVEVANAQGWLTSPIDTALQALGNTILTIMSYAVYLSGKLLDFSIVQTLNISRLVDAIGAIETGWKVFRDLCTMFFIFILLYTAITTILGIGSKEDAKKVITSIVIAGLFVNFSLFFTRVAIDASNVVSMGFYKALVPNGTDLNNGLSAIFMQSLYLQTTFDPQGMKTNITNDGLTGAGAIGGGASWVRMFFNTIMGSIVMLIASIVFLAGAFFFMVRLVMLLLLMVTSPIAFAGEALGGKVASKAKLWRETLIDQCLFMPAYLAITYVGVKIIASPGFQTAINPANSSFSGVTGGDSIAVIFNYCVVIIFLMASLMIAKEFGVAGADTFSGWAKNVGLALPRMMGMGGSALAKNTLGYAGSSLDKSFGNKWIGNTRIGRSLRESTVGALAKAKFGGERSYKDEKERDKENEAKKRQIADNAVIKTADQIKAAVAKRGTPASQAEQAQIDAGEIAINKMSASDIVAQSPKMLEDNARRLNDNHIKAIIKSDKITDADKEKILKARFAPIDKELAVINSSGDPAQIAAAKTALATAVKDLSDTDIENLGYERLKDPALIEALPYSKIKTATDKKTENYSVTQKAEFKKAKLKPFMDALATTPHNTADIKKKLASLKLSPDEVAEFDTSTLERLAEVGALPPISLSKIAEKVTDDTIRTEIKRKLGASYGGPLDNYFRTGTKINKNTLKTLPPDVKAIYNFFEGPIGPNF